MRGRFTAPSPALVISLIALFVALGGTGYAATNGMLSSPSKAQIIKIVKGVAPPAKGGRPRHAPVRASPSPACSRRRRGHLRRLDRPERSTTRGRCQLRSPTRTIIDVDGIERSRTAPELGHADPGYLCFYDEDRLWRRRRRRVLLERQQRSRAELWHVGAELSGQSNAAERLCRRLVDGDRSVGRLTGSRGVRLGSSSVGRRRTCSSLRTEAP